MELSMFDLYGGDVDQNIREAEAIMLRFKQYNDLQEENLIEAKNTFVADVNELMVGYYLNNENWFDAQAKKQYETRIQQLNPDDLKRASGHAKVMALEFLKYAKQKGYARVLKVYWTARAGTMTKLTGVQVDQTKNPTDTLIKFSRGPSDGWLGLSAKSTKGKGDIGFKNPGAGTVDSKLNTSIVETYKEVLDKTIVNLNLPKSMKDRKSFIRANPEIKNKTTKIGSELMSKLRDLLLDKLESMDDSELLEYFLEDWLNAKVIYPPYVKITGKGTKPPFSASVEDPTKNEKIEALQSLDFNLEKIGNESIGIKADSKRIFKIRFKFESEKMASSMKLSGDPW
tara:strand:+ start:86 stop:1111 length:1026 start_codon:yes stop_codon:yes gene_type:complete